MEMKTTLSGCGMQCAGGGFFVSVLGVGVAVNSQWEIKPI